MHACDALVHALLLRLERGCSATQHHVSARQSGCSHEKEELTTSRFVRVIYSSHIVYNRVGIVSPSVAACPSGASDRTINPRSDSDSDHLTRTLTKSVPWRCCPHAPRRCSAWKRLFHLHPRVCPLLERRSCFQAPSPPGTAAIVQSGKVHVSHLHNPCVWRRIGVRRSSPLPYSATSLLPSLLATVP